MVQRRQAIKTVRTAAQLLRQFTVAAPEHGVTDLARLTDLDKTSTWPPSGWPISGDRGRGDHCVIGNKRPALAS